MSSLDKLLKDLQQRQPRAIARAISIVEDGGEEATAILTALDRTLIDKSVVLGITGPPGAGKSTLVDKIIAHYRGQNCRVGVIAVDPSSAISGGALLGDRVRMMKHSLDPDVIVRSMATRGRLGGLCAAAGAALRIMAGCGCSPIIIETVGVGQSEMDIVKLADITAIVLAPGLGDEIQAMKAGLIELADLLVINKADCPGAQALALEMDSIIQDRQNRDLAGAVCLTVAIEGKGVDQLANFVTSISIRLLKNGEMAKRRQQAYDLEVLDWALDLLRPQIIANLKSSSDHLIDPRQEAGKIVDKMTNKS